MIINSSPLKKIIRTPKHFNLTPKNDVALCELSQNLKRSGNMSELAIIKKLIVKTEGAYKCQL